MKNLRVLVAAVPLFIAACSIENTGETSAIANTDANFKKLRIAPHNADNPYDAAGDIHNDIMEAIEDINFDSKSIEYIANTIDSVSASHAGLVSLPSGNPTLSIRLPEIAELVNDSNALANTLSISALGASARNSISAFIDSLVLEPDTPYEDLHSEVVSYEAAILANDSLSTEEKRIILTTTSLIRYSAYKKKRKDKDWETSVTSIAAAVRGSDKCIALGLKMAVTVGLCKNNDITE